jgi:VCBS repeat-containing protein
MVTITINPINDSPVAADDTYATDEDTPLTVTAPGVLANDTDVDSASLAAIWSSGPANGTLALNGDGSFTYSPDADFAGSDSFTYQADDGAAGSNTATVTITVSPVNDSPQAANDSAATTVDTPVSVDVLANDSDVDSALAVSGVTQGSNGTVVNNTADVTYTPNAGWSGTDTFTYTVSDGSLTATASVTITVNAVPDAPLSAAGMGLQPGSLDVRGTFFSASDSYTLNHLRKLRYL